MQKSEYEENSIYKEAEFKKSQTPQQTLPEPEMTFDQLCECMTKFFNSRDYESKQGFKHGYGCVVGEDYTNIDLLCNLAEMIYNHCSNTVEMSKSDKKNMRNICSGLQQIYKGLQQYDTSVNMDNVLIAQLMGYILKITRNYFNDRRR